MGRNPFDSNLTRQGNIRALIHIREAGYGFYEMVAVAVGPVK
jgi:hypothetical protein